MVQIHSVKRHAGVAGEYAYTATVEYEGEGRSQVTFKGSVYGGPIVMITESGAQTFVSEAVLDRIGRTLSEEWVRGFFA